VRKLEINNSTTLSYCGLIIDTFASAEYNNTEFWWTLFEKKINNIINIKNNDPVVVLHYIFLYCTKLVRDERFSKVYQIFVEKLLNQQLREVFENKEIIDFALKVNFGNTDIEVANLNFCLKIFFNDKEVSKKPKGVAHYAILFQLLEHKLFRNENVTKKMVNALLDILKISDERFSDKILSLKEIKKISSSKLEKIHTLLIDRIASLMKASGSPEDDHKVDNIIKCLIYSEIFGKYEIVKLKYKLEKEEVDIGKITGINILLETFKI